MNGVTYWPLSAKKGPITALQVQPSAIIPRVPDSPNLYAYDTLSNFPRYVSADRVPIPGPTVLPSIPIHEKNDSPNLFAYQALADFSRYTSNTHIKPSLGSSNILNIPIPERLDLINYNLQYNLLDLKGQVWPSAPPQVTPIPIRLDLINYQINWKVEGERPPISGPISIQSVPQNAIQPVITYPDGPRNYDSRQVPAIGEAIPQPKLSDSINYQLSYVYSDRINATISGAAPVPAPLVHRLLDSPDLYKYDALRNASRFTSELKTGPIQGAVITNLHQLKTSDLIIFNVPSVGSASLTFPSQNPAAPLIHKLLDGVNAAYFVPSYGIQNALNQLPILTVQGTNQTFHFRLDGVNAYWFIPPQIDYSQRPLTPPTGGVVVLSFESLLPSIGMGR